MPYRLPTIHGGRAEKDQKRITPTIAKSSSCHTMAGADPDYWLKSWIVFLYQKGYSKHAIVWKLNLNKFWYKEDFKEIKRVLIQRGVVIRKRSKFRHNTMRALAVTPMRRLRNVKPA